MQQRKKKVLLTRPLPRNPLINQQLDALCAKFDVELGSDEHYMDRQELLKRIADVEGVLVHAKDKPDRELMDHAPRLSVISSFGAGYDAVDVGYATEKGIQVCNTPDPTTNATADVALALLLQSCRRLSQAEAFVRSGEWERAGGTGLTAFWGRDPEHKTLGIIGLGKIGQALARRVAPLRMNVLYYNRHRLSSELEEELNAKYVSSLEELLPQCDFISIHTPLSAETRHLLDKPQFEAMKDGVYIINTSRGAVINEKVLVEYLQNNKVGGAGLDVFENEPKVSPELLQHPSVTVLPHIGTATLETRSDMFLMALANLTAVLEGQPPLSPVNKV